MNALKNIITVFFTISLFLSPNQIGAQSVVGSFKALKAEKIGRHFYVIGVSDKSIIEIARYDENLDLVKKIARPVKEIGGMFGAPYVAPFFDRDKIDLRIVYSSNIVAWLSFDLNLNELSLTEHDYLKNRKEPSQPNSYNPVYSQGSYASIFGFQRTMPGFYIKNKFYHFLTYKSSEFSNTSNEKFIYSKDPNPVFRKLETPDGGPFYNEISRIDLSQNDDLKDFDFKKYRVELVGAENGSIYFLATKKTRSPIKDDVKLMKVNENTLQFDKTVDLNLDSVMPELGSTFFTETFFDSLNSRIIQIGNYTGVPYTKKWWNNEVDLQKPYMKLRGMYVCEFDKYGKVKTIKTLPFPEYNLPFTLSAKRFHEEYKAYIVHKNSVAFTKDGGIQMAGENCVLTTQSEQQGQTAVRYSYFAPLAVTFLNLDATFQKLQSKSVFKADAKRNTNLDLADHLIEFNPQSSVDEASVLLTQLSSGDIKQYMIFSAYYGMRYFTVKQTESVMLYTNASSVVFNPSNKNGVYEFTFVPNKK